MPISDINTPGHLLLLQCCCIAAGRQITAAHSWHAVAAILNANDSWWTSTLLASLASFQLACCWCRIFRMPISQCWWKSHAKRHFFGQHQNCTGCYRIQDSKQCRDQLLLCVNNEYWGEEECCPLPKFWACSLGADVLLSRDLFLLPVRLGPVGGPPIVKYPSVKCCSNTV